MSCVSRYHYQSYVCQSPEEVFAWYERQGSIERMMAPWDGSRVIRRSGGLEKGTEVALQLPLLGPTTTLWVGRHSSCDPPHGFTDVQVKGPFSHWEHRHNFHASERGTRVEDVIVFHTPGGPFSAVATPVISARLNTLFHWRHQRLAADLNAHSLFSKKKLHFAVSGASGLVGTALTHFLRSGGHTVTHLVRKKSLKGFYYSVDEGFVDPALSTADVVVHLAGAPIAKGRWTKATKAQILQSRVRPTQLISANLKPHQTLICASAVGYYGHTNDREVDENSPVGTGFLAEVAKQWEAATLAATEAGCRVVNLRIGLVLSARGGLLKPLLPVFRAGAGGPSGSGNQGMPWIHLDDLLTLILALSHSQTTGPINATAPNPVSNRTFARELGRVLRRPALMPTPAFALRALLGSEKANELVLQGQRATPKKALELMPFAYPTLKEALAFEFGQLKPTDS